MISHDRAVFVPWFAPFVTAVKKLDIFPWKALKKEFMLFSVAYRIDMVNV